MTTHGPTRATLVIAGAFLIGCLVYALMPHTDAARWVCVGVFAVVTIGAVRHIARHTPGPVTPPALRMLSLAILPSLLGVLIDGFARHDASALTWSWIIGIATLVIGVGMVAAWERELTRDPKRLRRFFNQPW